MRTYFLLVPASALLLAACGNDTTPTASTPSTVSALAVSVIDTETCDTRTPDIINGRVFIGDQDTTDVSTLKPACTAL